MDKLDAEYKVRRICLCYLFTHILHVNLLPVVFTSFTLFHLRKRNVFKRYLSTSIDWVTVNALNDVF